MLSIGAANQTVVLATINDAVEHVIATTTPVSLPKDSLLVLLLFMVAYQAGTAMTLATLKVRQGSSITGGLLQDNLFDTAGALTYYVRSVLAVDIPIMGAQPVWSLTITGQGNTGNLHINNVTAAAIFLS